MELYKSVRGLSNMHEDSIDLGSVYRSRFDREVVRVAFTDFHPWQAVRALAGPGEHGFVTVDADHGSTVTDTFRQRR